MGSLLSFFSALLLDRVDQRDIRSRSASFLARVLLWYPAWLAKCIEPF